VSRCRRIQATTPPAAGSSALGASAGPVDALAASSDSSHTVTIAAISATANTHVCDHACRSASVHPMAAYAAGTVMLSASRSKAAPNGELCRRTRASLPSRQSRKNRSS